MDSSPKRATVTDPVMEVRKAHFFKRRPPPRNEPRFNAISESLFDCVGETSFPVQHLQKNSHAQAAGAKIRHNSEEWFVKTGVANLTLTVVQRREFLLYFDLRVTTNAQVLSEKD